MGNNLLSAKATLPVYDRNNLIPRIVHLGFGAFHRAHQGVYADILAAEHFSDWGYYEVNSGSSSRPFCARVGRRSSASSSSISSKLICGSPRSVRSERSED